MSCKGEVMRGHGDGVVLGAGNAVLLYMRHPSLSGHRTQLEGERRKQRIEVMHLNFLNEHSVLLPGVKPCFVVLVHRTWEVSVIVIPSWISEVPSSQTCIDRLSQLVKPACCTQLGALAHSISLHHWL